VVFGISSTAAAFSRTTWELIAARAAMGAGGALIMPATVSSIRAIFTGEEERKRAFAIWTGGGAAGLILGPLLGGALLDNFSWSSVFLADAAVAGLGFAAVALLLPDTKADDPRPRDTFGNLLSIFAVVGILFAVIESNVLERGWFDPRILASLAVGVASVVGLVLWERRRQRGLLDLTMFRDRRFTIGTQSLAFGTFVVSGALFLINQFLQQVQQRSAFDTGLALLPFAVAMIAFPYVGSFLDGRIGTRNTVVVGFVLMAIGLAATTQWAEATPYPLVAGGLLMIGAGMGTINPAATSSVMGAVPPSEAGMGAATNDTLLQIFGATGVGVMGALFGTRYANHLISTIENLPSEDRGQLNPTILHSLANSVAEAVHVSRFYPGFKGEWISGTAKDAFVNGQELSMWAALALALVGGVLTFLLLPARRVSVETAAESGIDLSPEEEWLYEQTFRSLRRSDFARLVRQGTWQSWSVGEQVIRRGAPIERITVLLAGRVTAARGERVLGTLGPGEFIGTMALATEGEKSLADQSASEPTRGLSWPLATLRSAMKKSKRLSAELHQIINRDMARKLRVLADAQ
jgi:DHA2 family multidrug resistance protein-like MFS transporter